MIKKETKKNMKLIIIYLLYLFFIVVWYNNYTINNFIFDYSKDIFKWIIIGLIINFTSFLAIKKVEYNNLTLWFVGLSYFFMYGDVFIKKLKWNIEAEGEKVLVIHTLCIKPSFLKMGLGQKFIIFAENYAKELGCTTIRLDTNDKNIPGANLYKKMGYNHVGNADFNFQGLKYQNLKCFDKIL